jgi:hypothetical protein
MANRLHVTQKRYTAEENAVLSEVVTNLQQATEPLTSDERIVCDCDEYLGNIMMDGHLLTFTNNGIDRVSEYGKALEFVQIGNEPDLTTVVRFEDEVVQRLARCALPIDVSDDGDVDRYSHELLKDLTGHAAAKIEKVVAQARDRERYDRGIVLVRCGNHIATVKFAACQVVLLAAEDR